MSIRIGVLVLASSLSCGMLRSNVNTRESNSRETYRLFGHNSKLCGNFRTTLRHKLPIIHPDFPIPTRDLNSSVQPEFLNPKFLYRNPKNPIKSYICLLNGEFPISPFWGATRGAKCPMYSARLSQAVQWPSACTSTASACSTECAFWSCTIEAPPAWRAPINPVKKTKNRKNRVKN